MKVTDIISFLGSIADPSLQEEYDNSGLITGDPMLECKGVLISLDVTEEIVHEAVKRNCNLLIAHHPIIFRGLKRISVQDPGGKALIAAIKHDIAIYAMHTNLDNVLGGVSGWMAKDLGLTNVSVLAPRESTLKKLFTYAPMENAREIRDAIFAAGGGRIGNYSECSFNVNGTGTFKAGPQADPYVGKIGELHQEDETRIEIIFPSYLEKEVIRALKSAHPYEEVAYEIILLANKNPAIGSGVIGELEKPLEEEELLEKLKAVFHSPVIRHSALTGKKMKRIALCGGAGSFLIHKALASGADVFITSDLKYHDLFEANGNILLADIGHFESEQGTISLLQQVLAEKFPTFAVLKTAVCTNPVHYFLHKKL